MEEEAEQQGWWVEQEAVCVDGRRLGDGASVCWCTTALACSILSAEMERERETESAAHA